MKPYKKIILTILAALPLPAIAIPAESKLIELNGENRTDDLRQRIVQARSMLFHPNILTTTIDDAVERVSKKTGITNQEDLEREVLYYVDILMENNLIQVDEKKLVTIIRSEFIR